MAKRTEDEAGFLARWSRRKREAEAEPETPLAVPANERTEQQPDPQAQAREAEELAANRRAAEAVDIDKLGYGDDFTVFLKRGVPDFLRKRALRKLWRSDPLLANLDGLNDYDTDYGDPSMNRYASAWNVIGGFLGSASPEDEAGKGKEPVEAGPVADTGEQTDATPEPPGKLEQPVPASQFGDEPVQAASGCEEPQTEGARDDADQPGETPRRVPLRRRHDI